MKATLRIINIALVLLIAVALGFCSYMLFQLQSFYPEDQLDEAARLRSEAESMRAETQRLREELQAQAAANAGEMDLSQVPDAALRSQLETLRTQTRESAARRDELLRETEIAEDMQGAVLALRKEYAQTIRQLEDKIVAGESEAKICYWTLDDGPTYTTQGFLDAAEEMGIYVTFFTSREANESARGDDPEVERALLRKEAMGGHSVQNHTNSHQYSLIAGNLYTKGIESFQEQVQLQDEWVYECTGIRPDIFRFPGGSAHAFIRLSQAEVEKVLEALGYVWINWSCDIFDNGKAGQTANDMYNSAVYEVRTMDIAVLLSHDWNENTLAAFKRAVPVLKEEGYLFLPLFSDSWTIGNTEIMFG